MADDWNTNVSALDLGTQVTTQIAGRSQPATSGNIDGDFANARFSYAYHLAGLGNDLFVTDIQNTRGLVRKLSLSAGTVEHYAGQPSSGPIQDGTAADASLVPANGIAVSGMARCGPRIQAASASQDRRRRHGDDRLRDALDDQTNPTVANIIRHANGVGSAARFEYPTGIVAVGNRLILADLAGVFQSSPHPNTPRAATIRAIDRATDIGQHDRRYGRRFRARG